MRQSFDTWSPIRMLEFIPVKRVEIFIPEEVGWSGPNTLG